MSIKDIAKHLAVVCILSVLSTTISRANGLELPQALAVPEIGRAHV